MTSVTLENLAMTLVFQNVCRAQRINIKMEKAPNHVQHVQMVKYQIHNKQRVKNRNGKI